MDRSNLISYVTAFSIVRRRGHANKVLKGSRLKPFGITGVQGFIRTCLVNTTQWKGAGSVTQHLNENVSDCDGDGDVEKIRSWEAKIKLVTHWRSGNPATLSA
jgi:hypothetical protein